MISVLMSDMVVGGGSIVVFIRCHDRPGVVDQAADLFCVLFEDSGIPVWGGDRATLPSR